MHRSTRKQIVLRISWRNHQRTATVLLRLRTGFAIAIGNFNSEFLQDLLARKRRTQPLQWEELGMPSWVPLYVNVRELRISTTSAQSEVGLVVRYPNILNVSDSTLS